MVLDASIGVPRAPTYSGASKSLLYFDYGILTLFDMPSQTFRLYFSLCSTLRSYNPGIHVYRFGLFPFRSPLLWESLLFSFPPGTEMFHFPGSCLIQLCIHCTILTS